jgi:hypothetical protein
MQAVIIAWPSAADGSNEGNHMPKLTTAAANCTSRRLGAGAAIALALGLVLMPLGQQAASAAEAPIGLGTAGSFAVLAGSAITNTGPTTIVGDVGLAPGTAITGLLPVAVTGTIHATDAVAVKAQSNLTTAYTDASGRSPVSSGLTELGGQTLTPGVYSGGALSVTGTLTLSGDADDVFVFQAASTLDLATASDVVLLGDVSACNVFWQVTSSATLGTGSNIVGTVMALTSITAKTGAAVEGRLLARNGAVTLDSNIITAPAGCAAADETPGGDTPVETPGGGTPVGETPTDGGTPVGETPTDGTPVVTVPGGTTPGEGTGTPTPETPSTGTPVGATPNAPQPPTASGDIKAPKLAETGADIAAASAVAAGLLAVGALLMAIRRRALRRTTN